MKASEVFDLPVSVNHPFTDEVKVGFNSVYGDVCIEFHNNRQAYVAAKCINHADALADALACVLEAYFSKGGVTTDIAASALESLKAYAGESK